jgi:Mrp family chromosome partitioning ATPase
MSKLDNTNPGSKEFIEQLEITEKLKKIKNKYVVLSGKGGVGKSSVSVNLAAGLALEGMSVGLLDIDLHGPSVPGMLNLKQATPEVTNNVISPVKCFNNLKVMSIAFLLKDETDAVVWRGPLKMNMIKQFLHDVDWGELDFLIIDSPPGTGDEPLSICQLIENLTGVIVVTTPQEVALRDVRKSIKFCNLLECPVTGVIENMSGFICPHCNEKVDIFKAGGGFKMAEEMKVPFLGSLPIDASIVQSADNGRPFICDNPDSEASKKLKLIIQQLLDISNI